MTNPVGEQENQEKGETKHGYYSTCLREEKS